METKAEISKAQKPKDKKIDIRTEKDFKLSENFSFYEFIEGTATSKEGHRMNWENIAQCDKEALRRMAARLEAVREDTNRKFVSDTGAKEIGLQVTSGWRCRAWELYRNRTGRSQHTIGAADVIPVNCSNEQRAEIMQYWEVKYLPRDSGWEGGFAIVLPKGDKHGFAHFDNRAKAARWTY